jgi:homocysteine S-methyltransferase
VQGDLLAAHALDVRNVFVVMCDPTAIGDYPNANDNYDMVPSGLIKLIKRGFNAGVDHAGSDIGQPTTFFAGSALNLTSTEPDQEIKNLRRKLRAGSDFVMSQPIYDTQAAICFLQKVEEALGEPLNVPLLMGILPLANSRHTAFLHNEVPGIIIPETIRARMEAAGEKGPVEGVKIAIELVEQMRPYVQGIYIMPPFNRFDYAAEVIEAVNRL